MAARAGPHESHLRFPDAREATPFSSNFRPKSGRRFRIGEEGRTRYRHGSTVTGFPVGALRAQLADDHYPAVVAV